MSFTYKPLWDMLKDKGITKMEFAKKIDISSTTLAKLSKNEPITLSTIDKICNAFHCKIENVVNHIQDVNNVSLGTSLSVGTVILFRELNGDAHTYVRTYYSSFVVVNVEYNDLNMLRYYISPVTLIQHELFTLKVRFKDQEGHFCTRWIDFSRTMLMPTEGSIKVVSQLSSADVDIINKFFASANEIITSANSNFYNRQSLLP